MSATDRRPAHREVTSADSAQAVGRPGNARPGEVGDAIACLDVLAAHLRARGWTTYINTPDGRLAFLFVQAQTTARNAARLSPLPTTPPVTGGTGSAGPSE